MRFEYTWTEARFIESALLDHRYGPYGRRHRLFTSVILMALMTFIALQIGQRGLMWTDALLLFGIGAWLLLRKHLLIRLFKRSYRRAAQDQMQLTFELTDEGIEAGLKDQPSQQVEWRYIHQVIRVKKGFLVYPGPYWLPNESLQGEVKVAEVGALFQRKVDDYKDLS